MWWRWREAWATLLGHQPLVYLLQGRVISQIGQNALLYTLLLVTVDRTGSSFFTALMVVSLTSPSIVLGLPGGALADVIPPRWSLVGGAVARVAIGALMVANAQDLPTLYLLAFLFAAVGQVVGPAESAVLPLLVENTFLARANALFVLVTVLGQLGGGVILAPFLFKLLGPRAVMVVVALLYVWLAMVLLRIGTMPTREPSQGEGLDTWEAMLLGWRILTDNRAAYMAMVLMTATMLLLKTVVVLAPHYVKETLNIEAENVVFVMVPAALGAGLAILSTPLMGRFIGVGRAATVAFVILLAGLVALGLVVQLRDFILAHLDLGISFIESRLGVSSVITLTVLLAVPVGLMGTMVLVATRTILHQEAPLHSQARVFATQSAIADGLSLIPTLALGSIADLAGARWVLLGTTLLMAFAVVYALQRGQEVVGRLRRWAVQ